MKNIHLADFSLKLPKNKNFYCVPHDYNHEPIEKVKASLNGKKVTFQDKNWHIYIGEFVDFYENEEIKLINDFKYGEIVIKNMKYKMDDPPLNESLRKKNESLRKKYKKYFEKKKNYIAVFKFKKFVENKTSTQGFPNSLKNSFINHDNKIKCEIDGKLYDKEDIQYHHDCQRKHGGLSLEENCKPISKRKHKSISEMQKALNRELGLDLYNLDLTNKWQKYKSTDLLNRTLERMVKEFREQAEI